MALDTFSYLRQRVNYLIGDTSSTTSAIIDSHINAAIEDICNAYPFSWNKTTATGTLGGVTPYFTFNLATNYNPKWHIDDARFVGTTTASDHIFNEIMLNDRNIWAPGSYKYYIYYDTVNLCYVFATTETSGSIPYYYYFKPTVLVNPTDSSIVPDSEAVCYLAASKNWLTDERNQNLMAIYKQESSTRIQSMWQTDNAFGPVPSEGTVADDNIYLSQQ